MRKTLLNTGPIFGVHYGFEYMRKTYWGVDGIWSDGYFVSTVGLNEEMIRKYIEKQGHEDRGQASL